MFVPQIRSDWWLDINTFKVRKDLPGVVVVERGSAIAI
jgi:hypothetical protein